jgi:hypothetical protein
MLFRVTGTNRDTNAPMVLDIEAVSRGAAEIKAQARGMLVSGMEDITADAVAHPTSTHRGEGPAEGTTPDSGGRDAAGGMRRLNHEGHEGHEGNAERIEAEVSTTIRMKEL